MTRRMIALAVATLASVSSGSLAADAWPDRFVWVFGWSLERPGDVAEIVHVLDTAGKAGLDGAVLSLGLDSLCKKSPEWFERLDAVRKACQRNGLEPIPAVFSVGYGGAALQHDPHLAEGLPVEDAPFVVRGGEARLVPDPSIAIANGGFEDSSGHRLRAYAFHDQPGEVSFVDTEVRRSGKASLRLESFTSNPHGHGRVMQEVRLHPRRAYRVTIWVRTEGLEPASAFQMTVLAKDRSIAPRTFKIPSTTDWRRLTMVVNSLDFETVRLYAGVWGGKKGKLWLDDWSIEEIGPFNVLRRPGTPVAVRSDDGAVVYEEGKDYARLEDPSYRPYRVEGDVPPLRVLPGGRIRDGQKLRVSWYHPMVVHDSQVTVCMGEPALYEIFEHEAKLLGERLHPRAVLLNMDEVRMGGTCEACRGRPMGELLGSCITRQAESLRRHSPGARVYVWSDMLDPNHNARADYYLVRGDFTGSWDHVPKDLVASVWGGEPREKSLRFFADLGFETLVACYYDADDLEDTKTWIGLARGVKGVRGFMYTPWERKYEMLVPFGRLLR